MKDALSTIAIAVLTKEGLLGLLLLLFVASTLFDNYIDTKATSAYHEKVDEHLRIMSQLVESQNRGD